MGLHSCVKKKKKKERVRASGSSRRQAVVDRGWLVAWAQPTGCPVSLAATLLPCALPCTLAAPSAGGPWNSRWGCLVPWLNQVAQSHNWKAANPPRDPLKLGT